MPVAIARRQTGPRRGSGRHVCVRWCTAAATPTAAAAGIPHARRCRPPRQPPGWSPQDDGRPTRSGRPGAVPDRRGGARRSRPPALTEDVATGNVWDLGGAPRAIGAPASWPFYLTSLAAMPALAGLNFAGAVFAKQWADGRHASWFSAGRLAVGRLFAVYAASPRVAELSVVTFGGIAFLQVGLLVYERVHHRVELPPAKRCPASAAPPAERPPAASTPAPPATPTSPRPGPSRCPRPRGRSPPRTSRGGLLSPWPAPPPTRPPPRPLPAAPPSAASRPSR